MPEDINNTLSEGVISRTPEEEERQKRREYKRQLFKIRREGKTWEFTITSLMDALTILLCFLLITLTSDPMNIKMDEHLLLAKSTISVPAEDAIPLTIKKSYISVDMNDIVKVECTVSGGRVCSDELIKRRAFCDKSPEDCSPDEIAMLKSMNFYVDKTFKENGDENSFLIVPLFRELEKKVKEQKEENKELGREYKGLITIICDRDIPFRLIAEIVHTAGMAELHDIRFAIIKASKR